MIYLLDTNMVSYIVKRRSLAASGRLLALPTTDVAAVSAITVAEIKYGLAKRPEATALRSLMEAFLASIRVLRWGSDEADAYGTVKATLEKQGITLGNMDMMIAAQAIVARATVVTNDRAFARVPELSKPVNWATDL